MKGGDRITVKLTAGYYDSRTRAEWDGRRGTVIATPTNDDYRVHVRFDDYKNKGLLGDETLLPSDLVVDPPLIEEDPW